MQTLQLEDGKTALVIVAHPDDETIWLGGTIMKYPEVDWVVFSLCRSSDTDRAPKFTKVCQRLGAKSIITDLDDDDQLTLEESIPEIKKLIAQEITKPVDYLFFHGPNGEYGHERHVGVYQAIKEMIKDKQLSVGSAFFFNYQKENEDEDFPAMITKEDTEYITQLSLEEFNNKKAIMSELYGFAPDGPDANYCTNPEGFKKLKP